MKAAPVIILIIVAVAAAGLGAVSSGYFQAGIVILLMGALLIFFSVFLRTRRNKKALSKSRVSPVLREHIDRRPEQARHEELDFESGAKLLERQDQWLKMLDERQRELFKDD